MTSSTQLDQFRAEGYFLLPDAFPAEQIDELTAHIDHFAEAHENELKKRGAQGISRPNEISFTFRLAEQDPAILAFAKQDTFIDLTTSILKADIALYWDQSVYKKPETSRDFPWHQDTGYVLTDPPEYVTCWLALNDVTVENGCIWIIPGTHKQGVVEHKDTSIGKQCYFGDDLGIPVPLKKGGMVVFSSLLFHKSGPNVSNMTRKGYILQYSVADAKNPVTGERFDRLVIARNGQVVHA